MSNPIEVWKSEKHPFDVWFDVEQHAAAKTPMKSIAAPDLERMKWHGFLYRKRDGAGRYMSRIRINGATQNGKVTSKLVKQIVRKAG